MKLWVRGQQNVKVSMVGGIAVRHKKTLTKFWFRQGENIICTALA